MNEMEQREREIYKRKVQKQQTAIDNLLDIASQHTRLFKSEMRNALTDRKKECERLYRKLDKNEFEIAIVGLEKAGKSTFANALMDNKILPDADERCTYTSTCIKYGRDKAVVKFFTESEFDEKLRDNLAAMEIENVEKYSLTTLSKSEYMHLYEKLPQSAKTAYGNNVHKDIINILDNKDGLLNTYLGKEDIYFEGEQLTGDELKTYIVSPDVAISVKEVVIESSKLQNMQNAIIYDVPGFDSPTKIHAEQTEERMKKADVIILIASAEKPSFTAPSLEMFTKVVDEDNVELSDKLFVFGNRADAANTLQKNMETLRSEVQNINLLSANYINTRILYGSAKAHLQKIGQEQGDFCIKKIEELKDVLPHGDGIEYTSKCLQRYNETDRFRILKRKINENDQNIQEIFKQLREEYKDVGNINKDMKTVLNEQSKFLDSARKSIQEGLQNLRQEVRNKYNSDRILSERMQEQIDQLFTSGKYLITDEEVDAAQKQIDGITSSIDTERVEMLIRDKKFNDIYNDFSETVLKIAKDDHKEYYDRIVELFEDSLSISKENANYDVIKEKIEELVAQYKKSSEESDSYQALIERFVRDLVEVLIMRPYGLEARLNRFMDDKNIFSGLIMFFDPSDSEEFRRVFMSTAPKDQPLLYAILFHEYKDSISNCKSIWKEASKKLNELQKHVNSTSVSGIAQTVFENIDGTEVIRFINLAIKRNPIDAVIFLGKKISESSSIPKFMAAIKSGMNDAENNTFLRTLGISDENSSMELDFTNDKEFRKVYTKYFGDRKQRTYESVREEYAVDLEILQQFLLSASIPAITIEKPFIAKEVKSIDGIIDFVGSSEFSAFISNNFELLQKETMDEYTRKQREWMVNQSVIKEIENVLSSMDDINDINFENTTVAS